MTVTYSYDATFKDAWRAVALVLRPVWWITAPIVAVAAAGVQALKSLDAVGLVEAGLAGAAIIAGLVETAAFVLAVAKRMSDPDWNGSQSITIGEDGVRISTDDGPVDIPWADIHGVRRAGDDLVFRAPGRVHVIPAVAFGTGHALPDACVFMRARANVSPASGAARGRQQQLDTARLAPLRLLRRPDSIRVDFPAELPKPLRRLGIVAVAGIFAVSVRHPAWTGLMGIGWFVLANVVASLTASRARLSVDAAEVEVREWCRGAWSRRWWFPRSEVKEFRVEPDERRFRKRSRLVVVTDVARTISGGLGVREAAEVADAIQSFMKNESAFSRGALVPRMGVGQVPSDNLQQEASPTARSV
jgi:hypothetical protein